MKATLRFKKGPGRGWWAPPKGTHTASNVPGGDDHKALAKQIGQAVGVSSRTKKQVGQELVLFRIENKVKSGALPRSLSTAMQGLQYARVTSRISGTLEMGIRKLKDWPTIQLLSRIAIDNETQATVPKWLNANEARILEMQG